MGMKLTLVNKTELIIISAVKWHIAWLRVLLYTISKWWVVYK